LSEGVEPEGLRNELSRRIDPDGRTRPLGTCFTQPVNYPVLTDGALGFPATSAARLHPPSGRLRIPDPYISSRHGLCFWMRSPCVAPSAPPRLSKKGNIPYGFISRPIFIS